jgi:RNA polymerase sigma-70 factor (ECF subfamily)
MEPRTSALRVTDVTALHGPEPTGRIQRADEVIRASVGNMAMRRPTAGPAAGSTAAASGELVELYVAGYRPLVGLLTVISRDASVAEDVAQDAFVRLLEHWPKVAGYDDPMAWVRTVAVRLLISRHRRQVRQGVLLRLMRTRAGRETTDGPDELPVDLDAALAQLSDVQRAVIVLHHLYDLPVEEVAVQLHVPVGTVKSRLSRARAALAPALTDLPERDNR